MLLTHEDILACSGHCLAIDTETTGLSWHKDSLIGIGIHCPTAGVSGYVHTCTYKEVPYGKPKKTKEWQGEMDYSASKRGRRVYTEVLDQPTATLAVSQPTRVQHFLSAVHEIAQNPKTTLVGHNLKFDCHFLRLNMWEIPCKIIDTSVLVHLYDSRLKKSLGAAEDTFLQKQTKRHHVEQADKRFAKMPWMWGAKVLEDYCTNDCVVTHQLAEVLMPLIRQRDLLKLLSLQMKYLRLLQKIEWRGIKIENAFCHKAIEEFEKNLISMERDLFDTCGKQFNWRSPSQLSEAVYEGLGISKPDNPFLDEFGNQRSYSAQAKMYTKSATGTPLLVKSKHPLRSTIIDIRETAKLKEYAEKYLELQDENGILHASFNITGTVTGRISSSSPNLQNLPSANRKYDVESVYTGGALRVGGYNLRQALTVRDGYTMVSIDHKQQEARLLAILADEPTMLEYMRQRKDIHLGIAISVWGDQGKERNKIHRDWSKATVFGLSYGMSEESLQEHYDKHGIEADARVVRNQFFETFPGLEPWFETVQEEVRNYGYVRYWSGRYWHGEEKEAYKGVNALIQGGAGDFLQLVLIRVNQVLEKQGWGYIVSIIHDEVLIEIKNEFVSIATTVLARIMEGEDVWGVPFVTDVETGDSYGSLAPFAMPSESLEVVNWQEWV